MAPFCVMCHALGHTACVSDCPYATLVFQGVINPLQLKTILYLFGPSAIHREMTAAAEEDRAAVIEWFWYYTSTRMEDAERGAIGVEERIAQRHAAKKAELEAEIAGKMEEIEDEMLRQVTQEDVFLTALEAAGFTVLCD